MEMADLTHLVEVSKLPSAHLQKQLHHQFDHLGAVVVRPHQRDALHGQRPREEEELVGRGEAGSHDDATQEAEQHAERGLEGVVLALTHKVFLLDQALEAVLDRKQNLGGTERRSAYLHSSSRDFRQQKKKKSCF